MNPNAILNFESSNKADALLIHFKWRIPYHVQEYITQRAKTPEANDPLTLFRAAWQNPKLDKRSDDYRNSKKFLLREIKTGKIHNFTDEQLKTIIKYGPTRKCSDISLILFEENTDQNWINGMAATIGRVLEAIGIEYEGEVGVVAESDDLDRGDYKPPQSDEAVINKINRCDPSANYSKSKTALDSHQRKCVRILRENLGNLRFQIAINSYRKALERRLFETEFIRQTYDKPDLIADDINACIDLSAEYVRDMQIQEMINLLDDRMKATLDGDQNASMTFTEDLKGKVAERKACKANIKSLQDQINKLRSKRQDENKQFNQSLAKFVMMCSDQNYREKLLNAERAYKDKKLQGEIQTLSEMSETDGEVHGISVSEILGFEHFIVD